MTKTDIIIYKNLHKEMIRKHISISEIADGLGIPLDAMTVKLSIKGELNLGDAGYITRTFFSGSTIDSLFAELVQDVENNTDT